MRHEADRDGPRSRRHLILDAAIEQFGELGFEYTKWADIADQAGIGETGLYHYFESKAHCLLSIMSSELDRSWQRFLQATANQEDHSERLRLAVASAFDVTPREALSARILLNHLNLLSTKRRLES